MTSEGVRGRPILAAIVGALLGVAPSVSQAVSPEARALFDEGRRLMGEGSFTEACARFSESYGREASSGTLLNLALCHEKEGKTAKSYNLEAASAVGKRIAERALAKGVKRVVFDRGGYIYHGRVKALADAAREGGLEF